MLLLTLLLGCPRGTEVRLEDAAARGLRCEELVPLVTAVFHADGCLVLDGGTARQGSGTWSVDGDRLTLVGSVHDPHADRYPEPGPARVPTETVYEGVRLLDDGENLTLYFKGGDAACR